MSLLPSSSPLLLVRNHSFLLSRFGIIGTTNKLLIDSRWAENQQHLIKSSTVRQFTGQAYSAKEGLALKTFLTLVREGKRKRDVRSFSGTSMAESSPSEGIENLHVTEHESSRGSKTFTPGIWRRKDQRDEAEKLSASVFVDASLLRFLVGKGASTKERIEKDTGVRLKIPLAKDAKTGKQAVILQGDSQEALDEAKNQVHEVIDQAIKSSQLQYSHFVSIPLALHSKLLESVVEFQKSVLESVASSGNDPGKSIHGIDKSIFVKPATFHLTLLMLKLWNEERVQAAADCLQKVMPRVHEALEGSPLRINLKGVDCMQGNPAKAHVLYADVEPDDQALRLIKASQVITEAFTEAGLVMDKDQTQTLKLHATLMNTTQRSGGGPGKRYTKRMPFDATEIVAKYDQYVWGEYNVSEAHLSQRFVYDENGYYHCCSSIPFPETSIHVSTPE
ncbi:hypothetical protein M758_10G156200 [Ceratodon purpureus]|nr:hypothetical protein M758_10G156200 [Ceratodon purpureus]